MWAVCLCTQLCRWRRIASRPASVRLYPICLWACLFYPQSRAADTQSLTSAASTPGAVAINIVQVGFISFGSETGALRCNLISQLFYAELCSTTIGVNRNKDRCPGCSSDNGCNRQWIFGDDMSSDTDKAAVRIGDFDHCNSLFNDFMRHFGGVSLGLSHRSLVRLSDVCFAGLGRCRRDMSTDWHCSIWRCAR